MDCITSIAVSSCPHSCRGDVSAIAPMLNHLCGSPPFPQQRDMAVPLFLVLEFSYPKKNSIKCLKEKSSLVSGALSFSYR